MLSKGEIITVSQKQTKRGQPLRQKHQKANVSSELVMQKGYG